MAGARHNKVVKPNKSFLRLLTTEAGITLEHLFNGMLAIKQGLLLGHRGCQLTRILVVRAESTVCDLCGTQLWTRSSGLDPS
jgi:hypothetical protein